MARILAISSHVVRGRVGLGATVPALEHLGHEVWALPTVLVASRAGLGRTESHEVPADYLVAALSALEADGCWEGLEAVFTGYFPSAESVGAAARAIGAIRAQRPGIDVLVDPVLGDADRLYVRPAAAAAIRDLLLPLATIASPNRFELEWLSGTRVGNLDQAVVAARALGPPNVLVTSAAENEASVTTLLITPSGEVARALARRHAIPNGPGDAFAGLFLGRLLAIGSAPAALDLSLSDLDRVLRASEGSAILRLGALGAPA